MTDFFRYPCLCLLACVFSMTDAQAQTLEGLTWTEQKCVLYERAVDDTFDIMGTDGFTNSFLEANIAFIASGCMTQGDVCPVTEAELEFADFLTVMTMNEGMASTFVPFGCPN